MTAIQPRRTLWRLAAIAVATSLTLTACPNKVEEMKKEQRSKMAQLEPTINVFTVQPQNILLENNLPGRLESVRTANIMPQVNGIVKRRLFQEGSVVKAGQPLYEIDDATYQANLQSAQASLLQAQAALAKANTDVERYTPLVQADAISKQEFDAAVAAKRSAEAQVAAAQAAINVAEVSLGYTKVFAPITGHIGQSLVTEGALVNANSTKMAVITQNDPMYVNITQSSSDMLKLKQQLMNGQKVQNSEVAVGLTLEDGSEYPHKGRLMFADTTVDEKTGQVTIRAAIANPNQILMNGMYVRVNLPLAGILGAFPVPQRAVTRGKTDSVMLAKEDGTLEPRTVKVSGQKGDFWIITEGLQAGERVVIDGTMSAGMLGIKKFKLQEWQPEQEGNAPVSGSPESAPAESTSEPATAPTTEEAASEAQ
ncbi:efflux RND transporter periplasmic adaptor subunit [Alysiella crassa]|uniref:Acriflavine resistance protein A n=1 Tax=Alysiella crassa TaxID=153491 RepID=A0A376BJU2_9NEIS|nr:efflux RND transporter periplasmic adaptor subunit [Alysiella crassa]UOP07737.1 efflux RND transporter periplasmic adaptor subunit [Alysiella crassa]SSY70022.1 Acriflavine resistance protein A precursor [Alysiella crassa]